MVANCDRNSPRLRRMLMLASALAVGFSLAAAAQTTAAAPDNSASEQSFSSSRVYQASLDYKASLGGFSSSLMPAAAAPSPQYGNSKQSNYPSYPNYQSKWSHIAFVGGGGFTAPIGNATHGYETFGYNLDFGGGWNFTKNFGILFEYQFDRLKIPGRTIALVGAQGGNINTHLFLFNPVYYHPLGSSTGVYVTGGAGFSRKVTNFTDLVPTSFCYYICYPTYAPQTIAHFSSTQAAADAGFGLYWKAFGEDSRGRLFVESRYIFVNSPRPSKTGNGEGTEELIPVTLGLRF